MLKIDYTHKFQKDVKRLEKRGRDMEKLWDVAKLLSNQESLAAKYRNHKLTGNWQGFWELHIEPDWLLIYEINETILFLARTGTHSDLF